jgi:hypothetical protein
VSLTPVQMSVPASDGLILKGTLTYPAGAAGRSYPLAVLAHQYPATRDSYAPLVADLLEAGIATLAFDERGHGDSILSPRGPIVVDTPDGVTLDAFGAAFVSSVAKVGFQRIENEEDAFEGAANAEAWTRGLSHARSHIVPGSGHAMAIYFAVRDGLVAFLRDALLSR